MSERIVVAPTADQINRWADDFVPDLALWFLAEAPGSLPEGARLLERAALRDDPDTGDIRYVNAYHQWAVASEATHVVIDDGAWLASLTAEIRHAVRQQQIDFRRGLVVPRERFPDGSPELDEATIDAHVVLDRRVWLSLPLATRRAVIAAELPLWDDADAYVPPPDLPEHIARVANAFVDEDGGNCLSITAYCLTGDAALLTTWMMPDAFLAMLAENGFEETDDHDVQSGDIVVYRQDGDIVHAAYALAPNRYLNKNGQTRFNPIRVIEGEMLAADWGGQSRTVWRRGEDRRPS